MSIKKKLEQDIYDIVSIPSVLTVQFDKVLINKNAPKPNELKALENGGHEVDLVETKKLKAKNRDAILRIGVINKLHFKSRERFDKMCLKKFEADAFTIKYEKIGIDEILDIFVVDLSCNMEYYKDKTAELVIDLNRKVEQDELNELSKLGHELFHKLMRKWIGNECKSVVENDTNEKEKRTSVNWQRYKLKNFSCHSSSNFFFATAQNEESLILFTYEF